MELFDRFRKSSLPVPFPQLCYDVAYFILPHYAFQNFAKLEGLCQSSPTAAGPFFYLMAAEARKVEPSIEDAKRLRWHCGKLNEDCEYFALEYPSPPAVDFSNMQIEQATGDGANVVLAPHFSVIVRGTAGIQYFILGQAPIGGGTTLRCILPEGANCNLGPGPAPELTECLNTVRERVLKTT